MIIFEICKRFAKHPDPNPNTQKIENPNPNLWAFCVHISGY